MANAVLPAQALAVEPIAIPGLPSVRISEIVETADHRLWFGGQDGLWVHDGHSLHEVALPAVNDGPRRVRRLCAAGDEVLVAMHSGVGRIAAGGERMQMLPGLTGLQVFDLAATPDGTIWLRTLDGARRYHDGQVVVEPEPGTTHLANLVISAEHLWSWDDERVWCRALATPRAPWREVVELTVRDLQPDGDGVLAIGRQGIVRLAVDRSPQWLVYGDHGHGVVRLHDQLWVRHNDQLLVAHPGCNVLRRVEFFHGGSASVDLQVQRLLVDSSGLLWLGTQIGLMRVNLCPGVDNLLIDTLQQPERDRERPGAILELRDGRLVVGTNQGRLLVADQQWGAEWQEPYETWPAQGAISRLVEDPVGRLWVGTRLHGLWCGVDGSWQRIGADLSMRGVRDLLWFAGKLWVCANRRVLRFDVDGGGGDVPEVIWDGEQVGGLPSSFALDREGCLWLGTYRTGLLRYDAATDGFAPVALAADSALSVDFSPDGRQLVAATTHELWTIDPETHVAQLWPSLGRSAFRDLEFDSRGTLWQTRSRQLLQFDNQKIREVGPGSGAHPLGYAYHAGCRLQSGDVLFGARGGFTRVKSGASLSALGRARLTAFEVIDAETGAWVTKLPGQAHVSVSPSFRVTPLVLDRSIDLPLACSVRLEPLDDDGPPVVGDGDFAALPAGRYHASVEVLQVNGASAEITLGTFVVAPVGASLTPWLLALLPLSLLGVIWWQMRRLVVAARRPELERVLTEAGHDPDEVLDLAFVVVGAAEACLQASGAQMVSAWVKVGDLEPALLAQFGADSDPALQCLAELPRSGPGWHSCDCEGQREILIELGGSGELAFQVLLVGVGEPDEQVRPAVERALQPARAALDRSIWVDRLQAFCVNSSLAIEADLHDLRSSLTVLRLGVAELRRERGSLDPLIGNLGNATDALLQAVQRLQAPRAMQLACEEPLPIVRAVLDAAQSVGASRRIRLELHAAATPLRVRLDPVWFRRALENVVGNAMKYSDDGATVEVSLFEQGSSVCVHVDDTGPGIDAEERSQLFLPGVVGKAQPRNGESKTGIGLWVSRQAMRAMGGTMWIEPRPGGGTRVILQLPLEAAALQPTAS